MRTGLWRLDSEGLVGQGEEQRVGTTWKGHGWPNGFDGIFSITASCVEKARAGAHSPLFKNSFIHFHCLWRKSRLLNLVGPLCSGLTSIGTETFPFPLMSDYDMVPSGGQWCWPPDPRPLRAKCFLLKLGPTLQILLFCLSSSQRESWGNGLKRYSCAFPWIQFHSRDA